MGSDATAGKRGSKSANAFRTISEVSTDLDIPQHVLRFWEGKFSQLRPMKRAGGRRYYRPEDVLLLARIRDLLHAEGYTIRGVQKLLREKGVKQIIADLPEDAFGANGDEQTNLIDAISEAGGHAGGDGGMNAMARMELVSVYEELKAIQSLLRKAENGSSSN